MDANIKTPQDALEWLDRSIREEAELDGEISNGHAIRLGFIQNMLAKFPRRNCDVGTPEEQAERLHRFCISQDCVTCPCDLGKADGRCEFAWMQMPYEEGGAKRAGRSGTRRGAARFAAGSARSNFATASYARKSASANSQK